MALMKSISGIRGTIGNEPGNNFTPLDIVKFTSAYGHWLKKANPDQTKLTVVIGRDARISGLVVSNLVSTTLTMCGINVLDCGLSTTPTVEIMVPIKEAQGGIILTASHNPREWNALKLLNGKGEFLNAQDGKEMLEIAESSDFNYSSVDDLGTITVLENTIQKHIQEILLDELVDKDAIASKNYHVIIDAVNSTGAISIPPLLDTLGVSYDMINGEPNGEFAHNPEPLAKNLTELCDKVKNSNADLGIAVDPDVDRLVFVCNDGSMFGEEYTLVAVADYVLSKKKSATVSNLSSSRALADIAKKYDCEYFPAAVGEVNVVEKMKETGALIGGEGNGGIIYPALHYGRDALMGIALFLTYLSKTGKTSKELRESYPSYYMEKDKIQLNPSINVDEVLQKLQEFYSNEKVNTIDGVKIDFADEWVHLRKSNTEPIIRVYTESTSQERAKQLAISVMEVIQGLL